MLPICLSPLQANALATNGAVTLFEPLERINNCVPYLKHRDGELESIPYIEYKRGDEHIRYQGVSLIPCVFYAIAESATVEDFRYNSPEEVEVDILYGDGDIKTFSLSGDKDRIKIKTMRERFVTGKPYPPVYMPVWISRFLVEVSYIHIVKLDDMEWDKAGYDNPVNIWQWRHRLREKGDYLLLTDIQRRQDDSQMHSTL